LLAAEPVVVEVVHTPQVVQVLTRTQPQRDHQQHWERTEQDTLPTVVVQEQAAVEPRAALEDLETKVMLVDSEARPDQTLCLQVDQQTKDLE
jgi:hypothetical protein